MATSLQFIEYLDFEDLKQYTGWELHRVFYKHYLLNMEGASRPVVAAGNIVHPGE